MKVAQINATCGVGSTGKIAVSISELLKQQGIENYILYSSLTNGNSHGIACAKTCYTKMQALKSYLLGNYGFNSRTETRKIIAELERISPDVVLLHNIHSHDCNLEMLFSYFKRKKTKLYWTFHDCWAMTGYCAHFAFVKCDRWKEGCHHCPQRKQASWFFDRSQVLYQRKKQLFSNQNLTIITPSQWMADIVKESFLKNYPVKVIHNGIDLSIFKPTLGNFREKHGIPADKCILLGVAFDWGKRKGLDVFIELSERLDPEHYQIVLVGINATIDKQLPKSILSIHRTLNQQELAEIYTAANLFVNPTREDNYPTVNMEAIACGTPVLTFRTGGSPEVLDETCGAVVACDDIDALEKEIERICNDRPYSREACIKRAKDFDQKRKFAEYLEIYGRKNDGTSTG